MEVVGKYRLVRKLAEGGMAEVFLAQVDGPGGFVKSVVVKRVLPELSRDPSFVAMFMSEAKLVAQLNHPNIVQVFDFGLHNGSYFLVMEYVDGFNLRGLYKRAEAGKQPIPFELAARMVAGACEGLAYAHGYSERGKPLNIIHRDISPENLLVGSNGVVKVADFGIARVAGQQRMTRTGTVRGKLVYMAPEQMQGEAVDCQVDVFALGIVLYELICGRRPFEAKNEVDAMKAILTGTMTPAVTWRLDMPPELQVIIDKAMARSKADRFKDCTELQTALERFVAMRGLTANSQAIGKLVEKFIEPADSAEPGMVTAPAAPITVVLPPRELATVEARVKLPEARSDRVVLPSNRRGYLAAGIVIGLATVGAVALWPEGEVVAVPAPIAQLPAQAPPAAPASETPREEEYPIPPPPPEPPKPTLGSRVVKLFKPQPKPAAVAKLKGVDDDLPKAEPRPEPPPAQSVLKAPVVPVASAPIKPAMKGRLVLDSTRGVVVHNDTPFPWHTCEVRMPSRQYFRFEPGDTIEPFGTDNIRVGKFEADYREPDASMKRGWAMLRCTEGAVYLWWGDTTL